MFMVPNSPQTLAEDSARSKPPWPKWATSFLSYAIMGYTGGIALLTAYGTIVLLIKQAPEAIEELTLFVIIGSFTVAPAASVFCAFIGLVVDRIKQLNGWRQYFSAALLAEILAILFVPVWTIALAVAFTDGEFSRIDWVNKQRKIVKVYHEPRSQLFSYTIFGSGATRGLSPDENRYAELACNLEKLCFWQGCLEYSTPLLVGFPTLTLFALLSHNRRKISF